MKPASQHSAETLGGTPVDDACGAYIYDPVEWFQLGAKATPVPVPWVVDNQ